MDRSAEDAIVIIGGGLAGLAAANQTAKRGVATLLLEKGEPDIYPCNSRIATGSLGVAHTDASAAPDLLYRAIFEDTEGYAAPDLARLLAENAGRALRWLRAENVEILKSESEGKARWTLSPPISDKPGREHQGRGANLMLRTLTQNLRRRGGRIEYRARARDLLTRAGKCIGVRAEIDGRTRDIPASSVILADGGFQANVDILRRFICERPERLAQRNACSGHGDALLMAEAIGARLTDVSAFYGHLLAREAREIRELWPYPTMDSLASSAIIVNDKGERFIDEGIGGIPLSNAIARLPDPLSTIAVFDEAIWQTAGRIELIGPNPHLTQLGGRLFAAPDLRDLARALDLPPDRLVKTASAYNRKIEAGLMDQIEPARTLGRSFGSLRTSMARLPVRPLRQPPFYGVRLCAGISYTLGGIAIDGEARVMGMDGAPIEGLYAAGACTGGLEGGPIAGYVGGLMKALCTGLVAGDSASSLRSAPRA